MKVVPVNGVVFDMDGVLVDSEHLWEEAWVSYAAARGRRWGQEQTREVQGMSVPEWSRFVAAFVGDGDSSAAASSCVGHMLDAIDAGRTPLLPEASAMVREIASRRPIALATSAPREVIDKMLEVHALSLEFTVTVSSAEVARGKPCPDVYIEAVRRLGLPGPSTGIAVEDSANGIRAARAAGLHVVAIPNRTYPPAPDALALADHVAVDQSAARDHILSMIPQEA